jgi:hypothetical protein
MLLTMLVAMLHLRDLATGDRVKVIRVAGSAPVRGSIMLGRPLPVGESHRAFSGFMSVRPDLVGEALALLEEGDPDDLVTFLGSMHRPPAITNTDGEDMALTDITWSLPDGCRLDEALTGAGLTCDDGGTWTLVRDTVNQKRSVIASLRVTGSRLEGHVNSAERASELLQLVADVAPGAVHLDTEVQDLDFLDLSAGPAGPPPTPSLPDDPAMRAALEEHIMRYEQEWLDTSIPALSGRTPREAAADPIAREDLVRLLATLPSELDGDTFGMSADRLRAALSL